MAYSAQPVDIARADMIACAAAVWIATEIVVELAHAAGGDENHVANLHPHGVAAAEAVTDPPSPTGVGRGG